MYITSLFAAPRLLMRCCFPCTLKDTAVLPCQDEKSEPPFPDSLQVESVPVLEHSRLPRGNVQNNQPNSPFSRWSVHDTSSGAPDDTHPKKVDLHSPEQSQSWAPHSRPPLRRERSRSLDCQRPSEQCSDVENAHETLMTTCSRFASSSVMHLLLQQSGSSNLANSCSTVFACLIDVRGFSQRTAACNGDAEKLANLLDQLSSLFGTLGNSIARSGGEVISICGDALVAVWPLQYSHTAAYTVASHVSRSSNEWHTLKLHAALASGTISMVMRKLCRQRAVQPMQTVSRILHFFSGEVMQELASVLGLSSGQCTIATKAACSAIRDCFNAADAMKDPDFNLKLISLNEQYRCSGTIDCPFAIGTNKCRCDCSLVTITAYDACQSSERMEQLSGSSSQRSESSSETLRPSTHIADVAGIASAPPSPAQPSFMSGKFTKRDSESPHQQVQLACEELRTAAMLVPPSPKRRECDRCDKRERERTNCEGTDHAICMYVLLPRADDVERVCKCIEAWQGTVKEASSDDKGLVIIGLFFANYVTASADSPDIGCASCAGFEQTSECMRGASSVARFALQASMDVVDSPREVPQVGLSAGEIAFGYIGSFRVELAVIGSPMIVSAQLAPKSRSILVDANVASLLQTKGSDSPFLVFACSCSVKGFNQPLYAYKPLSY